MEVGVECFQFQFQWIGRVEVEVEFEMTLLHAVWLPCRTQNVVVRERETCFCKGNVRI